ncbi:hypothetical protein DYB32_009255 [Aphanomyces invadans]|uniref:Peptidase A2 domain-containing protein n=1 Tax=Aphanomyces invadans TaxID=157072 RepID=A0A418AIR3_9STRA|nr:hypothetical protein DYB32_009255 [Aphanomyces invadans]
MGDVDMGSDAGYGRGQVWNAPALPKAPTFKGSTKTERRVFMREYQMYLSQINAMQCVGSRPFAMLVSACMDPFSKRRIALFDLNKDHNAVTEAEWIVWFNAALEEEPQDLDVLKKRLAAAIRFDMKILDAESRVGRILHDLMRVLEQDHQEWVLTQEPKVVVEVMSKAVKPEALKTAVQKQLQHQRSKGLKNDVFRVVNWLRHFAVGFQLYVGVEELPAPAAPLKGHNPKGDSKNGARSGGGRGGSGVGGKTDDKGISPAKMDDGKSKEEKPAIRKKALVRVENVLLDTGADVNVVTRGVVDVLAVKGAGVTVELLWMKRSAKFGAVVLGTTCGPLTLRGLHCWIDDTSPEIDLIISRPVMELLGFSVDALLVGARQKDTEWDVSVNDEPPAHGMSKLQRMTTSGLGADEPVLADGDGMECATPEVAAVTNEEQRKKMRC